VAQSAPDGHTLLMVFDTHAVNHHLFKAAPDPFKQLEHISLMATSPSTLVAGTSFAPSNLREVVARAKADPGKVTYGSVGSGSSNHLGALLLEQAAGIRMTHVPYKGGAPLVQAMLGNQVIRDTRSRSVDARALRRAPMPAPQRIGLSARPSGATITSAPPAVPGQGSPRRVTVPPRRHPSSTDGP
jgi:hypothetical protein